MGGHGGASATEHGGGMGGPPIILLELHNITYLRKLESVLRFISDQEEISPSIQDKDVEMWKG